MIRRAALVLAHGALAASLAALAPAHTAVPAGECEALLRRDATRYEGYDCLLRSARTDGAWEHVRTVIDAYAARHPGLTHPLVARASRAYERTEAPALARRRTAASPCAPAGDRVNEGWVRRGLAAWSARGELMACEALAELGEISREALQEIKKKSKFDIRRIDEIEKVTKHDVLAFLTNVGEAIGPLSKYLHYGLTSSDILDTSLALLLKEGSEIILQDIHRLLDVLKKKAFEYKETLMIGRTHGIHAEPTTFGLKMALWYDERKRNLTRMEGAKDAVSVGKLSGAVGTFPHIRPFVEEYVCKRLGLRPAPISTQVVQRDHHAEFFTTLAIIASSIEKFAVELRHLQRTEVLEAEDRS